MIYPFITLEDQTEIVHSDIFPDNILIVYVEKPVTDECFHHGVLRIPEYRWDQIKGFTQEELNQYQEIIRKLEPKLLKMLPPRERR